MNVIRFFLSVSLVLAAALPAAGQLNLENINDSLPGGGLFNSPSGGDDKIVSAEAVFTAPSGERPGEMFVKATIQPAWHIYSITQSPDPLHPTKISLAPPPGVRLAGPWRPSVEPDRRRDPLFDNIIVEEHHGAVVWRAPLEFDEGVDPSKLSFRGTIGFQACREGACVPFQETPFTATFAAEPPIADESFLWSEIVVQLGLAFLGGLILNVMPCVLPVISLKLLAFMQQGGESRIRVFALNVWYSIGLISVFIVLAALAAGVGMAAGERLGWGEQFSYSWFKVAMTGLVFVMALSFLGVWEIPIPGFVGAGKAGQLQTREGPGGAFFKGVFTTILATPCSGPFLGPVFGYLLGKPPLLIYGVFAAVGLGMASPYLLIGAFPKLIRYLPKPGAWMETFKQLMGFLLLATVIYLFGTLKSSYFLPTMTLLLGLWIGCWWIGRTPAAAPPQAKATAWLGAIIVAVLAARFAFIVLFWEPIIPWKPYSPAAFQQARNEGKTIMVDFTADWCPNCKFNSWTAIERKPVLDLVRDNDVAPLLVDWSDHSPETKKLLNGLGFNSIPLLAIWPPDGEPILLPDLVSKNEVIEALKQAGPSKKR
ncbi:MAG: thioredoxin family protein [Pirellulales bacterium]|nr:thioredoxin family protein [Pirellulales bacterium]